jgi:putative nucleotidyltransferase with HDIG domain
MLGVIFVGGAVAVYSISDLVKHPVSLRWLVLVALTVASGWATLRIPEMPISFSISDTFNIAAALLFGPSAGAISASLDGLVLTARFSNSNRSLDRILFNMAAPMIAIWIGAQLFSALGGDRPLGGPMSAVRLLAVLTLFGTIDFGLSSGIVAVAVSFERRLPILAIWRAHLAGVWITYFGGIFGAMLLMALARFGGLDTLILIIPLPVILYVSFRHALGRAEDQISHLGKVNKVYVGAIEALAHAVGAKDQVTHDHTRRVQDQTVRLARALGVVDEVEVEAINAAGLLHDVGKLAIPEHILNKPGQLTAAEYEIMKRHAAIGAEILSVIGLPYDVAPIVRHHHENWDGTGYPDGLAGDRIPIGSRILAVVDCFDALTSDRPYRTKMEDRDALEIVSKRRGNMYDPGVVDAFFALQGPALTETPAPSAQLPVAAAPAPVPAPQLAELAGQRREDLELQTFFNLGRALDGVMSMGCLGEALWTHFKQHVPATAFVLYAYEEASDTLAVVYKVGEEADRIGAAPIPLGERLSGWVAATGETVMNSDARLDFDDPAPESALRSALAVPIVLRGRPLGVLSFYAEAPNAFDAAHRRLVEAASRVVGERMIERLAAGAVGRVAENGTRVLQTSKPS